MNKGFIYHIDNADFFKKFGLYALIASNSLHLLFIPLFFWLGADQLALINILSISIYLYCIAILPRSLKSGDYRLISWLVYFELIGHAILACYYLGVHSGFQYYAYVLVALPFLALDYGLLVKILRVLFLFMVCVGIEVLLSSQQPIVSVESHILTALAAINISVFLLGTSILTYFYVTANIYARERLSKLASLDPLTGLNNRRTFSSFLEKELIRAERYNHAVSMLILDIDFFKNINDTFGHDAGDRVLSGFAEFLGKSIRSTDLLARYGGEEFAIVLPQTNLAKAMEFGERLRKNIFDFTFAVDETRTAKITSSIGVSEFPTNAANLAELVKSADKALYTAKQTGRNKVETSNYH